MAYSPRLFSHPFPPRIPSFLVGFPMIFPDFPVDVPRFSQDFPMIFPFKTPMAQVFFQRSSRIPRTCAARSSRRCPKDASRCAVSSSPPERPEMNGLWLICPGWWFGTFFSFPYIGNNHPNWPIFFRGVQTTNQLICHVNVALITPPNKKRPTNKV